MWSSSQKHSISPDDDNDRPNKRSRRHDAYPVSEEESYTKIMANLRYKMKKGCNESLRSILQRPSLKDGPEAAEMLAHHMASFFAHEKHCVDFFYPSMEQTGEVVAFGSDDGNQLGLSTSSEGFKESDYLPTLIPKGNLPSSNVKMIACGGLSSFALTYDGTVYSWGDHDEGQLGRGDIHDSQVDKIGEVPIKHVIQIAAGNTHTVFLDVDGLVFTTGLYYTQEYGKWRDANTLSELNRQEGEEKDFRPNKQPYRLRAFDQKVIRVAAGNDFSAALLEDGKTLVTWGLGFDGQLGRSRSMGAPLTDEMIEEGTEKPYRTYDCEKPMLGHSEEVKDVDGKIVEIFVTETELVFHNFLVPKEVDWDENVKKCKRRILDFACGEGHLLVVAQDEDSFETRVYSAGRNHAGQLGLGDQKLRHVLTPINALDNKRICKVTAGANHSLALNALGTNVWGWGSSKDGALGLFEDEEQNSSGKVFTSPTLIAFPKSLLRERIIDISSGDNTNFAITNEYNVYTWGFNVSSQAGIDSEVLPVVGRPRKLDPMDTAKIGSPGATKCRVLRAAAGGQHSLLLLKRFK